MYAVYDGIFTEIPYYTQSQLFDLVALDTILQEHLDSRINHIRTHMEWVTQRRVYDSNPTSFSSNVFHRLHGTNEFGFTTSIFQVHPYFHFSCINGKKQVKSMLSLTGMETRRLVCSKDLILTKLKKLEGNVKAMFGQKVDYTQQICGSAPQKMVIIKFKDDTNDDQTVMTQCFIHLDNKIDEGKKRKWAQKSVKKPTDYEESSKKQKRNKKKNVVSSEDETNLEDIQEIEEYADEDYYMPAESLDRKKVR